MGVGLRGRGGHTRNVRHREYGRSGGLHRCCSARISGGAGQENTTQSDSERMRNNIDIRWQHDGQFRVRAVIEAEASLVRQPYEDGRERGLHKPMFALFVARYIASSSWAGVEVTSRRTWASVAEISSTHDEGIFPTPNQSMLERALHLAKGGGCANTTTALQRVYRCPWGPRSTVRHCGTSPNVVWSFDCTNGWGSCHHASMNGIGELLCGSVFSLCTRFSPWSKGLWVWLAGDAT